MEDSIIRYSKFYEYERKYCENIESIINIAENIFVVFGARYKTEVHLNISEHKMLSF